jgi:hypothetical protein
MHVHLRKTIFYHPYIAFYKPQSYMKYIMLQFLWTLKFECVLEIQYR